MKNALIILFFALVFVACNKKKDEGNLQITGNIKGLNKGTLYIQKLQDTILVPVDSIVISGDSHFETSLNIDSPEMFYLSLDRGETNTIDNDLMFFAEPGKINIDTELETFYAKAKITGSENHKRYEEFKKIKTRFTNAELAITEKRLNALKDKKAFDPADEKKYEDNLKKRYLYTVNFAINNREYDVAPYVTLSEIPDATIKYLDTIQKAMAPKVAQGKYGKILTKYVADRKKEEQALQ